jgi:hypothetical protein
VSAVTVVVGAATVVVTATVVVVVAAAVVVVLAGDVVVEVFPVSPEQATTVITTLKRAKARLTGPIEPSLVSTIDDPLNFTRSITYDRQRW